MHIQIRQQDRNNPTIRYIISLIFLIISTGSSGQSFEWGKSMPENEGFSSEKLEVMRDLLAKHRTTSILVIKNDKIILEWYAEGWDKGKKHGTASLAKALVGGMSMLLAMNDGKMKPDDPVTRFIPEWTGDPLKSKITIRHLATHSSGIEDAEISAKDSADARAKGIIIKDKHMDIPGWKGAFWRREPDPFSISRDQAPVIFPPGTEYQYSNPGMALLAYSVTASYRGTDAKDIRTLLSERIYKPIGISDEEWSIGYGRTYDVDGLQLVANWGGGSFTPRAAARIGRLMLNKGNWEGKQLIDSSLVKMVVQYAGTPKPSRKGEEVYAAASGLAWYTNFDAVWPRAPRDLFFGSGAGNQTLIVIPSMNMIVVRNGEDMHNHAAEEPYHYGYINYLINPLMDAYDELPYPKSSLISGIEFAPVSSIIRKANDSDTWPITWGDDDNMYTAYGDGTGFIPKVNKKLSLGLAKITGGPEDFQGINIRSETGEHLGQGRYGKKASGMLMVDGILYMWVRNANGNGEESQVAWSSDHGKSWKYSDWKFTESFGLPVFLNFGKNYQGARDNFVYIYSNDEKDAYKPADRMIMARVPKNKILDLKAYEYFNSIDKAGKPVWSKNINDRGAVFSNPANCYRSGITYNPGLKRYLWCQTLPYSKHPQGSRFQGGFGIFEAPEPWGPWHTVFYTKNWDVGPGETSSLPVKWMSNDGKTCYLLFSGDDCFSVRKVNFTLDPAPVKAPYPSSSKISGMAIDWSSHQRHAPGSDNFQLTWADDDHQYGIWGDGDGFAGPNSKYRVSFGVARIEGDNNNYKGYDRYGHKESSEHEATIKGKSWGIISVKGNLYAWVHPDKKGGWGNWADHNNESRLYLSKDKGATWQAANWAFTRGDDLAGGNILQFGRDYNGAPDSYVYHYMVQQNAFTDTTGKEWELHIPGNIFLLRVSMDRLMERDAYEFFSGFKNQKPQWSKDINAKKPVFTDNNGVGSPVGISYNPGLKRYLLTTEHSKPEAGMIGVFEAQNPWGPWSTVLYSDNEKWFGNDNPDNIPANCFFWCFPTKWMSEDGTSSTMVFTGAGRGKNNDSFNTVNIKFILR